MMTVFDVRKYDVRCSSGVTSAQQYPPALVETLLSIDGCLSNTLCVHLKCAHVLT